MFTQSVNLPSTSRVWVYQANRILTAEEEQKILEAGKQFVESWTAHNQSLLASFEIRHHTFLIIMVDQERAGASGCSIDKSVHFIQQVEKLYGLTLLDRMIVAYKKDDELHLIKMAMFNQLAKEGKINLDTIVFNNLIDSKADLETKWEVPVSRSWHREAIS